MKNARKDGRFRKILAATDLTEASRPALRRALRFREVLGADLVVLHVLDAFPFPPTSIPGEVELVRALERRARTHALQGLEAEIRALGGAGAAVSARVVEGTPADAILDTAKSEGADLLVLGTHGRRGLERLFLGSVAERVLRLAACPVLAVSPSSG